MKNTKLTQLDTDQIVKKKFDEDNDAERVYLVGGEKLELTIDSSKLAKELGEVLGKSLFNPNTSNIPLSIEKEVEKHIFIPQIERIEIPVVVTQIEYREIEKPIIIEKIVTIEKPVIIKEIEIKEVIKQDNNSLILKLLTVVQTLTVLGILLLNLLKK